MSVPPRLAIPPTAATLSAEIREIFTPAFLREALARGVPGYRARVLTIEVMALALLHLVLARLPSLAEIVRDLGLGALPGVPRRRVSMSAFYKRLAVIPHTVFLALLRHASTALRVAMPSAAPVTRLAPFANGVYALDDTTLDALARKTKVLQATPEGKYAEATLGGRLGCVLDLQNRTFVAFAHDTASTSNERHRLLPLVQTLEAGALLVLDRGYFAFDAFDALSSRFLYWVTRLKRNVSFDVVATLADAPHYRDRLVHLGSEKGTERCAWPVRLVELEIGGVWWQYITNVWDPRQLPADRLWALYGHRWTIETAFAAVKRALGLATLHACHANGVLSQVWATLTVYHVLQSLRRTVADRCGWDEEDVSWELLMRRIGVYVAQTRVEDLPTWLVTHARDLGIRKTGRRLRRPVTLPLAVCKDLRTTILAPLPLDQIGPRQPKRRPSRAKPYVSEKFTTSLLTLEEPQ